MKSLKQNIRNIVAALPYNIIYTDRPKERASVDDGGLYINTFYFVSGHTEQANVRYIRHSVSISLYAHKIALIEDCNGDEDTYFQRLQDRICHFENILLDIYTLLFSPQEIKRINAEILAAFEAEIGSPLSAEQIEQVRDRQITKHDCPATNAPKYFCYKGPFISSFIRVGADLAGVSEADLVDFVTIQFEIWKPLSGLACCSVDGKFVPPNNPLN